MPEPTGIPGLDQLLVWGAAVTLLLGMSAGLWRAGRTVARFVARISQYLDDWYGEPERPGVPARPGVMERVTAIEGQVRAFDGRMRGVEHEMRPNSGASLRDQVDLVNCRLSRMAPDDGPCGTHTPTTGQEPGPGTS